MIINPTPTPTPTPTSTPHSHIPPHTRKIFALTVTNISVFATFVFSVRDMIQNGSVEGLESGGKLESEFTVRFVCLINVILFLTLSPSLPLSSLPLPLSYLFQYTIIHTHF
jgi:hypothetical protein